MWKINKALRNIFFKRGSFENKLNTKNKFFENVDFHNSTIGVYSYIARNSIVHNSVIGKFCSIGPNTVIGYGEHPTNFLSTSPIFYEDMGFDLELEKSTFTGKSRVFIGNDVWIGANVFVKNGVSIGDGCIIGAGAVVLDDIPAYAIVVGVPASVKSFRFDKEIINTLLEMKWWNWSDSEIKELNKFLLKNNDIYSLKSFKKDY